MQEAIPHLDDNALARALEAILMVVDAPASTADLAEALSVSEEQVSGVLENLKETYDREERGFELRDVAGGWRFYSRPKYDAFVSKFIVGNHTQKLTQAALETLAVIAYRQPVTRQKVSAIRGVNVDSVVRNLTARGLIEDAGETATGATLFKTTDEFLERMGLRSLDELSPLAPHLPSREDLPELTEQWEKK